jgi:carbon-monoxide dehydrogenase small subunit
MVTIEGLQNGTQLHPLQEAFVKHSAIQCGYCTPGVIMAAKALLDCDPKPSEEKVRKALANNLCRCTGYDKPVKAILEAAKTMRGKHEK